MLVAMSALQLLDNHAQSVNGDTYTSRSVDLGHTCASLTEYHASRRLKLANRNLLAAVD